MKNNNIRVRIAPSPSGNLHVGTARTALFNFLFAKNQDGKFILRIEDTDKDRSKDEYTQNIFDSLKAMGLNWDEGPDVGGDYGPYKQSERGEIYKKYAQKLVESGNAYECWCTQEELETEKQQATEKKQNYIYSQKCTNLSQEQIEQLKKEGRVPTLRFKMPSKQLKFNDLIKGELEFDTSLTGDFVIMKSNGTPTYNFAVVVDDLDMKMSHIIRGEDHISNTPKQIAIYEALGAKIPEFAHLGMILAPDKSKLSKRHGATAVSEFIEQGYLTESFVNFVAMLGWSASDDKEIMSLDEIIKEFSLSRVSSSPAVFEFDKLNWINGMYIREMNISELTAKLKPYLKDFDLSEYTESQLERIIKAVQEKLIVLSDIKENVKYFFGQNVEIEPKVKEDVFQKPEFKTILESFKEMVEDLDYNDSEALHEKLAQFRKSFDGIKPKQIMWTIRGTLTGSLKGADISEIILILGKDKIKNRIDQALKTTI